MYLKNKLSTLTKKTYYYSSNNTSDLIEFSKQFETLFFTHYKPGQEIAIICIGTDRVTADSLGPFVGHLLKKEKLPEKLSIWGCLSNPVHALNLENTLNEIQKKCVNPFCIVVDACLGCPSHIGQVTLRCAPLHPGEGVLKQLPWVGDISITGIVNQSSSQNYYFLENTRLNIVIQLASFIAQGLGNTFII